MSPPAVQEAAERIGSNRSSRKSKSSNGNSLGSITKRTLRSGLQRSSSSHSKSFRTIPRTATIGRPGLWATTGSIGFARNSFSSIACFSAITSRAKSSFWDGSTTTRRSAHTVQRATLTRFSAKCSTESNHRTTGMCCLLKLPVPRKRSVERLPPRSSKPQDGDSDHAGRRA